MFGVVSCRCLESVCHLYQALLQVEQIFYLIGDSLVIGKRRNFTFRGWVLSRSQPVVWSSSCESPWVWPPHPELMCIRKEEKEALSQPHQLVHSKDEDFIRIKISCKWLKNQSDSDLNKIEMCAPLYKSLEGPSSTGIGGSYAEQSICVPLILLLFHSQHMDFVLWFREK